VQDEPESPPERPQPVGRVRAVLGRVLGGMTWARRNAYLMVIAAAVLVVTRAIDFSPPPEVRVGNANVAQLVGDAPPQEFAQELSNPQAVQVRATLRLYPDGELRVGAPDPELDEQGKILSQPVVTTILGMNATVDQTVRLDAGDLEILLSLDATPRLQGVAKRGQPAPEIVLEHELHVRSRHDDWWRNHPVERVHLDSRGFLGKVEEHGHRVVFTVDEHLFSLDLEVHRSALAPTLAGGKPRAEPKPPQ
jgi:hypothetical protein